MKTKRDVMPSSGEVAQTVGGEPAVGKGASGQGAHAAGAHSCGRCGMGFPNEAEYVQHVRTVHEDHRAG